MWRYLLTAVALFLVVEGIIPFLSPRNFRNLMLRLSSKPDRSLRIAGLVSMLCGVILMYLVHFGLLF